MGSQTDPSSPASSPASTLPVVDDNVETGYWSEDNPAPVLVLDDVPGVNNDGDAPQDGPLMYPMLPDELWRRRDSLASDNTDAQTPDLAPLSHAHLNSGSGPNVSYLNAYMNVPANISLSELSLGGQPMLGGHYELNRSFGHVPSLHPTMGTSNVGIPNECPSDEYDSRRNSVISNLDSTSSSVTLGGAAFTPPFANQDHTMPRLDDSNDLYGQDMSLFFDDSSFVYPLA